MLQLNKTVLILAILLFIGLAKTSLAQDPIFSQPFSTAMYHNPALTGFADYSRIQAGQRAQGIGSANSYLTSYLGVDINSKNNRWGFGLTTMYDLAGETLSSFSQDFNLAYRIKFTENAALRIGLGIGFRSRMINIDKLTFGGQIDSRYGFIYASNEPLPASSINFINFNTGLFFHNRILFAGYTAHNWNEPDQSFFQTFESRLPIRHSFQFGVNAYNSDNSKFSIKPSAQYRVQQNFSSLILGSAFHYKAISFGLYSNFEEYFGGSIGLIKKRFQIRYSYDFFTSRLTGNYSGAHEITFGLQLGKGKDNRVENKWLEPLF